MSDAVATPAPGPADEGPPRGADRPPRTGVARVLAVGLIALALLPVLSLAMLLLWSRSELQALEQSRATSSQLLRQSQFDYVAAIAGQAEIVAAAAVPDGGTLPDRPGDIAGLERLVETTRVGRAGHVVIIEHAPRGDLVALYYDDSLVGKPVKEVETFRNLSSLLESTHWREQRARLSSNETFLAGNRPAEAGLYKLTDGSQEYWVVTPIMGTRWSLAAQSDLEGRQAQIIAAALGRLTESRVARGFYLVLAIVLVLNLLFAAYLRFKFQRGVVLPVRHLRATAEMIRAGSYDTRAQVDTGDELQRLAESINTMLDRIVGLIQSEDERRHLQLAIVNLLETVSLAAEGDLTRRGEVTPDVLGSVTDAFNHMLESIGALVLHVRHAGGEVTRTAEAILEASEAMSSGASRQASALDQVTRKIKALGERALEINRIVELVDEIAAQTNMLALNAAIEASRAGEQGKGFAVVADEVRKLAERSSSATKDIGAFIETIQGATDEAVQAMEDIRSVTRVTAQGSVEQTRAAGELVDAARALGEAIARFKVKQGTSDELTRELEQRQQILDEALRGLTDLAATAVDEPDGRDAVARMLQTIAESCQTALGRMGGRRGGGDSGPVVGDGAEAPARPAAPAGERPRRAAAGAADPGPPAKG